MLIHRALRLRTRRRVSIVEMIVGVTVGLIVIIGGLSYYLVIVRSNALLIHDARLAHELSGTLTFIADELRRAGYYTPSNDRAMTNPFVAVDTDLTILEGGHCILYAYDRNENAQADPNEFFGFRLRNLQIETRVSGSTTQDCNDGSWNAITDARITRMNELAFEERQFCCLNSRTGALWYSRCEDTSASGYETPAFGDALTETRQVSISIAGSLANDNYLSWQDYQKTVFLRNHRLFLSPGLE